MCERGVRNDGFLLLVFLPHRLFCNEMADFVAKTTAKLQKMGSWHKFCVVLQCITTKKKH